VPATLATDTHVFISAYYTEHIKLMYSHRYAIIHMAGNGALRVHLIYVAAVRS